MIAFLDTGQSQTAVAQKLKPHVKLLTGSKNVGKRNIHYKIDLETVALRNSLRQRNDLLLK